MQTGNWILIYTVLSILIFILWDVIAWKTGKATMSQIVIKASKNSFLHLLIASIFCWLIIIVGFWLIFHWELISIFKSYFK